MDLDGITQVGMPMNYCPHCGAKLEAGWRHCALCGAALNGQRGAVAEPPTSLKPHRSLTGLSLIVLVAVGLTVAALVPEYFSGETLHDKSWVLAFNLVDLAGFAGVAVLLVLRRTQTDAAFLSLGLGLALLPGYLADVLSWQLDGKAPRLGFWEGQVGYAAFLLVALALVPLLARWGEFSLGKSRFRVGLLLLGLAVGGLLAVGYGLHAYHIQWTAPVGRTYNATGTRVMSESYGGALGAHGWRLITGLLTLIVSLLIAGFAGSLASIRNAGWLLTGLFLAATADLVDRVLFIFRATSAQFAGRALTSGEAATLSAGPGTFVLAIACGAMLLIAAAAIAGPGQRQTT
jgi:hypothetical protein